LEFRPSSQFPSIFPTPTSDIFIMEQILDEKDVTHVHVTPTKGSSIGSDEESRLKHVDTTATTTTTNDVPLMQNELYRDGELILMPAPTKDPRDPLNLTTKRKIVGLTCLCLFGALAAAAELILGAMLPVFALYYAGINPKVLKSLSENGGLPAGSDPLKLLSELPGAPPIWQVYLLASLPVLVIGLANLALIPLAIAVGRRPVVLVTGCIAVAGAVWAGFSTSLETHIAARCVQAVGAGTVESLIPFIIQDMVHVHQRNTWISGVFALQGILIIALGAAAPFWIYYLDWRDVYFITAGSAFFFLIGTFFFMPETRWARTRSEMNGIPRDESQFTVAPRTFKYDLQFLTGAAQWNKCYTALLDTMYTFFYPQIFFITMLNSAMIACAFAAGYTASPALLTAPWS
jgi:MFS family permease